MTRSPYKVLFLCTGNSARSIMAEALLNVRGKGRFAAFSAGSQPTGKVNPFALEIIEKLGYPADKLRSDSWDEFEEPGAPEMDIVITVCDNAAGETCPLWPGHPVTAHWGFPDPAAVKGDDDEKREAFAQVFRQIQKRVDALLQLKVEDLDQPALTAELKKIGNQG